MYSRETCISHYKSKFKWIDYYVNYDCPCESLYKCSTNAFVFEQFKIKEKMQVRSKRTNPAFACVRVHTLVRSPAFTAECTVFFSNAVVCSFRTQKCVRNECSEWVICSKRTQQCVWNIVSRSTNFVRNKQKCLKQTQEQSVYLKQTSNSTLIKNYLKNLYRDEHCIAFYSFYYYNKQPPEETSRS